MITKNLNKNELNIPETMWHIVILQLNQQIDTTRYDRYWTREIMDKANVDDFMFFALSEDLVEKFEEDGILFADGINNYCDCLVLAYDADSLDYKQCEKLVEWLDNRLLKPVDDDLKELYIRLKEYAVKATELKTGISFDFR